MHGGTHDVRSTGTCRDILLSCGVYLRVLQCQACPLSASGIRFTQLKAHLSELFLTMRGNFNSSWARHVHSGKPASKDCISEQQLAVLWQGDWAGDCHKIAEEKPFACGLRVKQSKYCLACSDCDDSNKA